MLAGAYSIETILGTGSMGVVYQAEQVALKRKVALKIISETADDDTARARFRREARAASQINHPNVVQVYDFGELPGGQPFLAMELLKGRTLQEVIDEDFPIQSSRIRSIMGDILSALGAAHDRGILHRDLKPANVLISDFSDGREVAKVLDFGIATAMDSTLSGSKTWAPLTEAGFVCGTPAYMSPEQVQGFELDQRSDLFSAAGLAYQMLTRERPFMGKSPVEVGANIVLKPVLVPSKFRPDLKLPKAVDDFIEKALAKAPKNRFPNATAMAQALDEALRVYRVRDTTGDLPKAPDSARLERLTPISQLEAVDTVVSQPSIDMSFGRGKDLPTEAEDLEIEIEDEGLEPSPWSEIADPIAPATGKWLLVVVTILVLAIGIVIFLTSR